MNTRTRALLIGIAAPLCLTTTPSVANPQVPTSRTAAQYEVAMDACIKAFVSTLVPKERQIALRTEAAAGASLVPRTQAHAIALTATTRDSGKQLAKATCRTDRKGAVIALNGRSVRAFTDANASLVRHDR